jgi:hypothetical protein
MPFRIVGEPALELSWIRPIVKGRSIDFLQDSLF